MKTTTSAAQDKKLDLLKRQAELAAEYPGAYSAHLVVGHPGCHKLVGEALVARGLVDLVVVGSQRRITINAAGLAAWSSSCWATRAQVAA